MAMISSCQFQQAVHPNGLILQERNDGKALGVPRSNGINLGQQQGMSGGRDIHHHELTARLADDTRESLEHGDLFRTGRAQILLQQGTSRGIELRALGGQHMLPVTVCLSVRVDPADRQVGQRARQRVGKDCGRV